MYKSYNSYFVVFGKFVNFIILGFLVSYIYIYYTCRSLTCGGGGWWWLAVVWGRRGGGSWWGTCVSDGGDGLKQSTESRVRITSELLSNRNETIYDLARKGLY